MEVSVSCLLEGRDLAVVKSLININNIHGDLSLKYVDNNKTCQLLIGKDNANRNLEYYALNRRNGKKITIKPNLNPQSVKHMFEVFYINEKSLGFVSQAPKLKTFEQLILQNNISSSERNMVVELDTITLVLNRSANVLYSTSKITPEFLFDFLNKQISEVKFSGNDVKLSDSDCFKVSLDLFMWNLGCMEERVLINQDYASSKCSFKQLCWPNYGEREFNNEFISLSSMVSRRSVTYDELIKRSGYAKKNIVKFLNATLLSGYVVLSSEVTEKTKSTRATLKQTSFIQTLKRFFSIKGHNY